MLAKTTYDKVPVSEPFRRAIVDFHRKEAPGAIVVDSDNPLSLLRAEGRQGDPLRHHCRRGSHAWSGIAKIGSKTEWPAWHPTRARFPPRRATYVAPGPDNPMGSRALYLYSGGKDTLFRIHGTNQPEYIGASISSAASA